MTKVFIGIITVSMLTSSLVATLAYVAISGQQEENYFGRYKSLADVVGGTFQQFEGLADQVGMSALAALDRLSSPDHLPSDAELDALAKEMGVAGFYVVGTDGRFLRSSDFPIEKQVNSIFDYCDGYRGLLDGSSTLQQTPVLPTWPYDIPAKFSMMPNRSKTMILEAGVNLQYISELLSKALRSDANVRAIGLYAPNGYELGSITAGGGFMQGRRGILHDVWLGERTQGKERIISLKVPTSITDCCECTAKGTAAPDGSYYQILRLTVTLEPLWAQWAYLRKLLCGAFAFAMLLSFLVAALVSRGLVAKLAKISATADAIVASGNLSLCVDEPEGGDEVSKLAVAFNRMLVSLRNSQERLLETARLRSIATLASQVAHDIRSPVAALVAVSRFASHMPEEHRNLIREATRRVNDIANNLLSQHRGDQALQADAPRIQPELAVTLVHSVVSEQRARYAERDVEVRLDVLEGTHDLFVKVDSGMFKRVLVNLTNNAVEAISARGCVDVVVGRLGQFAQITITDSGCGIPADKIAAILEGGTTSKEGGSGIGLSSSRRQIEAWHGELSVTSELGRGTTVCVNLPISEHASWFAPQVTAPRGTVAIVLDDDTFIAKLWQQRILAEGHGKNVTIKAFRRCADFLEYFMKHRHDVSACLIDYEFVDDKRTGIDLVAQLDIAGMAYLVTSHDEDQDVRDRSAALGLRIIPKSYASYVPIDVPQGVQGVSERRAG